MADFELQRKDEADVDEAADRLLGRRRRMGRLIAACYRMPISAQDIIRDAARKHELYQTDIVTEGAVLMAKRLLAMPRRKG